ncbi:MAG: hypothetical protein GX815_14640, partial [Clostridiales bacterium]|nr:hypothetical protein [Clostridiales bacterium]
MRHKFISVLTHETKLLLTIVIFLLFSTIILSGCNQIGIPISTELPIENSPSLSPNDTDLAGENPTDDPKNKEKTLIKMQTEGNLLSEFVETSIEASGKVYTLPFLDLAAELTVEKDAEVSIGQIQYDGIMFYYVLDISTPMAQMPDLGSYIIAFDPQSEEYDILFTNKTDMQINKLVLCEDQLAWVMNGENIWTVKGFDLVNWRSYDLAISDSDMKYSGETVLSTSSHYIMWQYYKSEGKHFTLNVHDALSGDTSILTQEDMAINSPYWLPSIMNDTLLLLHKSQVPAELALYDLKEEKIDKHIKLNTSYAYAYLVNDQYLVWSTDYSNNEVWIGDLLGEQSQRIFPKENETSQSCFVNRQEGQIILCDRSSQNLQKVNLKQKIIENILLE